MSSHGFALARPAKNVVVYRNGDPFFHGRKFVVNQRQFLTFEAFLNEVTKSIHAPLAVRNLYTPKHGRRVAELADLQDGCQYVAAGFEKFKRLDYLNHGRKELRGTDSSNSVQTCTTAPWKPNNTAVRQQNPTHLTVQLCRLDGTLVSSGEELVNGNYYVAVGTEEYKKLPYLELLVPQDSVCRTLWHGLQASHKLLSQGKGMTTVLKMKSTA
ncbi:doublecortin domain-containing protein 2B isoform X3 [Meleagris gallopavo]|uniref:doublecortin domain-containing protein 2B isoform X3 n=1 Tax=Meleagris gallopavo TaxID=9103 RepID=UPI00093E1B69|nr:doublecortin domain-containing protein 2B isoform X3 [Meleagris gallopavo]